MKEDPEVKELKEKLNNGEIELDDLTDEEEKRLMIDALMRMKLTYQPNKVYGRAYKEKRRKKNKAVRKARKQNRK